VTNLPFVVLCIRINLKRLRFLMLTIVSTKCIIIINKRKYRLKRKLTTT